MCVAPMPLQCAGLRQTLCATQIEQAVDGTECEPRSRSGVASMADAMLQRHRLLSEEHLVDALGEREGGVEFGQRLADRDLHRPALGHLLAKSRDLGAGIPDERVARSARDAEKGRQEADPGLCRQRRAEQYAVVEAAPRRGAVARLLQVEGSCAQAFWSGLRF